MLFLLKNSATMLMMVLVKLGLVSALLLQSNLLQAENRPIVQILSSDKNVCAPDNGVVCQPPLLIWQSLKSGTPSEASETVYSSTPEGALSNSGIPQLCSTLVDACNTRLMENTAQKLKMPSLVELILTHKVAQLQAFAKQTLVQFTVVMQA
jgi:hypothetical protein